MEMELLPGHCFEGAANSSCPKLLNGATVFPAAHGKCMIK